jgi:hypothetical protein
VPWIERKEEPVSEQVVDIGTRRTQPKPIWDEDDDSWWRSNTTWLVWSVFVVLREAGMVDRADEWQRQANAIMYSREPFPDTSHWSPRGIHDDAMVAAGDRMRAVRALADEFVTTINGSVAANNLKEWRVRRRLSQADLAHGERDQGGQVVVHAPHPSRMTLDGIRRIDSLVSSSMLLQFRESRAWC